MPLLIAFSTPTIFSLHTFPKIYHHRTTPVIVLLILSLMLHKMYRPYIRLHFLPDFLLHCTTHIYSLVAFYLFSLNSSVNPNMYPFHWLSSLFYISYYRNIWKPRSLQLGSRSFPAHLYLYLYMTGSIFSITRLPPNLHNRNYTSTSMEVVVVNAWMDTHFTFLYCVLLCVMCCGKQWISLAYCTHIHCSLMCVPYMCMH